MEDNALMLGSADVGEKVDNPCLYWKDEIEEALSSIVGINWWRRLRSRGAWKDVLKQADIR